jgi:CelD/BcsL family acetyltransferase involved in cellulose biosynthesis
MANIDVRLLPLDDPAALEKDWLDLQERSEHSFFQSWGWEGCWLHHVPEGREPLRFEARADGKLVALGVGGMYRHRRRGFVVARRFGLRQIGVRALDEMALEQNGLLIDRSAAALVREACLRFFAQGVREARWDEVVLGAVGPEYENPAGAERIGVLVRSEPNHFVDLAALRDGSLSYLDGLSSNTRQQLRRSRRYFERYGPIILEVASTAVEALAFLEALLEHHRTRWRTLGVASAFDAPMPYAFHRRLIETRFPHGEIQMLRVRAGDTLLGYLYNFTYRRRVYFYQSGMRYESDPRSRPGLVTHWLAIEHNLRAGALLYDFLHSDDRYKRSLATGTERRLWVVLQRPRLAFRIENGLVPRARKVVRWLRAGGIGQRAARP